MPQESPFETMDTLLTAIAVGYPNKSLIGNEVAPAASVSSRSFKYRVTNLDESFKIPETRMSRTGKVNQAEFTSSLEDGSVEDNGLSSQLSAEDIAEHAKMGVSAVESRTQKLTELIMLRKEITIATMAQDSANYAPENVTAHTTLNDWTLPTTDIVSLIQEAQDNGIVDYNRMCMSSYLWNYVKKNPFVLKHIRGGLGAENITIQEFADAFELERVLKGGGRYDIAYPGEKANLVRAWGNSPFLYRYEKPSTAKEANTFMIDAVWAMNGISRIAAQTPQGPGEYGIGNSVKVVVGEYSKPLVTAKHYGHLFKNAAPTA